MTRNGEPVYEVFVTDRAYRHLDEAYLYVSSVSNPDRAAEWVDDLRAKINDLARFPGPRAYPIDEAATERYGREVHRLLYRGPKRRPIQTPYHILYFVQDPVEESDGLISVLRVRHALRDPEKLD